MQRYFLNIYLNIIVLSKQTQQTLYCNNCLYLIFQTQTTSAVIHQHHGEYNSRKNDNSEISHRDESGIERLPDEHVSIVETTDDREIARPVGTTRRKLYFNPAYFEPQLMAV